MNHDNDPGSARNIDNANFQVGSTDQSMLIRDNPPITAPQQVSKIESESMSIEEHLGGSALRLENSSHTILVFMGLLFAGFAVGIFLMWTLLN